MSKILSCRSCFWNLLTTRKLECFICISLSSIRWVESQLQRNMDRAFSYVVISCQFSWPTSNSPEEGPCWQWILMRASIEVLMVLNKVQETWGPDYLYNSQQPNGPLRTINERASLQTPDLRHCWSIEFWM